jgi:hypothetical protein
VTLSRYEIERLLARVASGTTTERDANTLRRLLLVHNVTDTVAPDKPPR